MKLDSKYFDSIRITKKGEAKAERKSSVPGCEWKGCDKPGPHKAPKGRGKEGEFFRFCGDHARQYNANYNFFEGMSDKEQADFQRAAQYGHRPTWKSGVNPSANLDRTRAEADAQRFADARASRTQGFHAWRAKQASGDAVASPSRRIKPLEKKALDALHLPESATKQEVKARYKDLVKQHHPDVNGGDRASEDKLREIIQAYNLLKQAGLG
jgi:DnaJ domain